MIVSRSISISSNKSSTCTGWPNDWMNVGRVSLGRAANWSTPEVDAVFP